MEGGEGERVERDGEEWRGVEEGGEYWRKLQSAGDIEEEREEEREGGREEVLWGRGEEKSHYCSASDISLTIYSAQNTITYH